MCKYCVHFNTLLLIFRHVVFNLVYLIFEQLQIKKSSFFLSGRALTPPPLLSGRTTKKELFLRLPLPLDVNSMFLCADQDDIGQGWISKHHTSTAGLRFLIKTQLVA